jgi:hypothetical protein
LDQAHPRRFAAQLGIARLYHYEKFCPNYLTATLRDQKIHCSNPSSLNDPWDCRPAFNSKSLRNPEDFEKTMAWFHSQATSPPPPGWEAYEARLRNDPSQQEQFMLSQSNAASNMIAERRIYCLTPKSNSTLMWSHYAQNHRGICLEFGVDNSLFRNALQVVYCKQYPVWIAHEFEARRELTVDMIRTKAWAWRYEKEFRLIGGPSRQEGDHLRTYDDFFSLPPGSLKSVVAGCEADYDAVSAIVKSHNPDLSVKRAVRVPDHYRLEIAEC